METFKKTLRFLPYWFFVPICNILYSVYHWVPESLRQYIFYLRLPLIAVFLLFLLLPITLLFLLRNVFVMSKWQQVFLSVVSVLLAGRSIIVVINSILENAPTRFNIPVISTLGFPWDYICSIALAIPMILAIISQTSREKNSSLWSEADLTTKKRYRKELVSNKELLLGIFAGIVSTLVIFVIDKILLSILDILKRPISAIIVFIIDKIFLSALEILKKIISTIIPSSWHWFDSENLDLGKSGYFYQQDGQWILSSGHLAGLSFFLIALLLFLAVGCYFRPDRPSNSVRIEAPIIIYMMALLAIIVPLLSTMTFALDQSRFPVILTAMCFLALSYGTWQVDYYFGLIKEPKEKFDKSNLSDFETAITNRLQFQDSKGEEGRTLVVVTASGGGIHAAGWTAQVLTGLQDLLGADFTKSVGLISSVSGGSVGSMFFVDYCDDEGAIKPDNLTNVFQNSVRDSLDTVGWGLVYRDLGNIVGLPWLTRRWFKIKDRGEALEYSWQGSGGLGETTLNSLGEKALAGQVPIPVFNTTLVEDGRRMLFSPMTFFQGETDLTIDSNTLYAGYDIKAVTAARLSATFPYVSPTSRSEIKGIKRNYHIVDGGYFDNSGVVTAIDWLDDNIEIFRAEDKVNVKRLVFLEIEAFESQRFNKDVKGRGGLSIALLAPITTLLKVKTASLVVRNLQEVKLLIEKYRSKLDEPNTDVAKSNVQYVKIEFPTSKYAQPLSWKLTASEKFALEKAWQDIKQNSPELKNLKQLWHEVWKFPEP
jgi:hypothetical protein